MKNFTLARFASAALCVTMASDAAAETGGGAGPAATDPKPGDAVQVTDAMKAEEAANAAKAAETEKSAGAGADEKSSYRVKSDFHDTTTGRLRKAGRVLKATDKRAAQLAAAKVIETDEDGKAMPIDDDEDEDDGEESVFTRQEDLSQATRDAVDGKVAPVGLDGPVDEAVAREVAEQGLDTTDGGMGTSLTAGKVPGVVTGNKNRKAK